MKVSSLILVDAIGVLAVAACVAVGLWCGLLGAGDASQQIRELTAQVQQLDESLRRMRTTLKRQSGVYDQRQAAFGARDLLPESTPVERELRAISDLARRHRLELTGFTPLGSKYYPGVRELRYRMTSKGRFGDYLRFLRDFEAGDSWADITLLSLSSANAQTSEGKAGELTISLYSATKEDAIETVTQ